MPIDDPVWFITGCSTGFGRALAERVLADGGRAVVTARNVDQVADIAGGADERALAVPLDVTDQAQVDAAVAAALERFGRIDVLVNNAGYGYQSSIEEGVDAEIRAMFDANVFGLFAMTRAVLPAMRAQEGGHVVNISSIGGLLAFPSSGYYSATKHAVEGMSDALAIEGAPLGIKVTCIEPGPFRTDFAGRSIRQTRSRISGYADTADARMRELHEDHDGHQAGDPVRAADAIIAVVRRDDPPRHFVLGAMGMDVVTKRMRERLDEIEGQRAASLATDFPEGEG